MSDEQILCRIRKADGAEVRAVRQLFKGRDVVDVRVWFQPAGSTEYVASRKGVALDAAKVPELAEALARVRVE